MLSRAVVAKARLVTVVLQYFPGLFSAAVCAGVRLCECSRASCRQLLLGSRAAPTIAGANSPSDKQSGPRGSETLHLGHDSMCVKRELPKPGCNISLLFATPPVYRMC